MIIMTKKNLVLILGVIVSILTIIALFMSIFGIQPVKNWHLSLQREDRSPFEVIVTPKSIQEGQYEKGLEITVTILNRDNRNITFLELTQENVILDRLNKTEQTKVSSINWEESKPSLIIYEKAMYGRPFEKIPIKGKLWGCENCFMGENSPYKITFTFKYKEEGNPIKFESIEKIIPIE